METFKRIDFWLSVALILIGTIHSFILLDETFIYWYFIVGGWQVISMLFHSVNGWFTRKNGSRYLYSCTVAVIIALGLLTLVIQIFAVIYLILLFAAPLMAIFYALLCSDELKELKKNHDLSLK